MKNQKRAYIKAFPGQNKKATLCPRGKMLEAKIMPTRLAGSAKPQLTRVGFTPALKAFADINLLQKVNKIKPSSIKRY
ncbi:MAG: hypothetical protein ACQXXG_02995 [Candidatus Bathyarchaeia archaeon]